MDGARELAAKVEPGEAAADGKEVVEGCVFWDAAGGILVLDPRMLRSSLCLRQVERGGALLKGRFRPDQIL